MHELAIAQSIVQIATAHAGRRRVTKVWVRVGHLRQVVASALEFSFELATEGTPAAGASLEIEPVPAAGICRRCGRESELFEFPLRCLSCGAVDLEITGGEELLVESLELEEPGQTALARGGEGSYERS